MLRFMRLRSMVPTYGTWQALVTGSARASKASTSLQLYLEMRHLGCLPTTRYGPNVSLLVSRFATCSTLSFTGMGIGMCVKVT